MPAKRRSMADLLGEQKVIEDGDGAALAGELVPSPVIPAVVVPVPHSPAGDGQLTAGEESDLTTCERALDNLRLAFAAAGKALQVIRDARLYRASYDTFEEYAEQRWDMSRQYAYRLIQAWPLAERLSPIGDKLTESQVRELLPIAGRHGDDAAATVYQVVAETDGVRVTAAVLRDVAGIFADRDFDPAEAVEQIRAYLASDIPALAASQVADPIEAFTSETGKLVKNLRRFAAGNVIRDVRAANPDVVRQAVADLRAALDQIEREIT
jgi:hypothetical protein